MAQCRKGALFMMTTKNFTATMTLTLHVGNKMHSMSFDCTDSDTWTLEQTEAFKYKTSRATERWLNLCQASLSVAKQKQATSSKT